MSQDNECAIMKKKPTPRPDLNHRPPRYAGINQNANISSPAPVSVIYVLV